MLERFFNNPQKDKIQSVEGLCPACHNLVVMTTDDGQALPQTVGSTVICNHCAAELEVVSEVPLQFEMLEEAK